MIVEQNVPLQAHNSFGIVAKARDAGAGAGRGRRAAGAGRPRARSAPKFVLGGGSNIVLTGDVKPLVLKVEVMGRRLVEDAPRAFIVEAGAGENWHDFVALDAGPGL